MPTLEFKCEVCGQFGRRWVKDETRPPRFCSRGCKHLGMKGQKQRKKYEITPEIHQAIQKAYQGETGNGEIAALAKRVGLPRWKISKYAGRQGWYAVEKKEPDWSEDEIEILKRHARHCPEVIQRNLKKAGFDRSVNGIVLKRRRLRMTSENLGGYSAHSLCLCLGVDIHFVLNAIRNGHLKASRRITNRTEKQGGDPYWIKEKNIKRFIVDNVNRIDLRKVDKYWFVDLLAGG